MVSRNVASSIVRVRARPEPALGNPKTSVEIAQPTSYFPLHCEYHSFNVRLETASPGLTNPFVGLSTQSLCIPKLLESGSGSVETQKRVFLQKRNGQMVITSQPHIVISASIKIDCKQILDLAGLCKQAKSKRQGSIECSPQLFGNFEKENITFYLSD
jgi:hypothetical protein